ncbi:MAG: T9SS type A sorting domain-containing protein [Melioribacteraceae bacterium]|nr:T9SS type A sorting domain-containing protein [Melioribacteraceae bacterium]
MKKLFNIVFLVILTNLSAQETIKLMTYNLLNYPGSTSETRNPYFQKTLKYVQPQILVVQEVISQESIDEFYTEVLKPIPQNYKAGSFINGPDSDNGIYYDSSKFEFISNIPITTELRDINQFTLYHPHSTDTLIIYSVHLKSSTGSTNQQQRLAEVDSLIKVTSTFSSNKYYMVVGDFNFYSSNEPAYVKLLDQSQTGYFIDPITISGTWNSPLNASQHTQSTRTAAFGGGTIGGLDDRFDLILFSQSINDFGGITYVDNSYVNFGNDGNHYDLELIDLPNSAVPDSIAEALYYASDHLPVIAEFVFENALPVELNMFEGYVSNKDVILEWETVSETNNYGFQVQRTKEKVQSENHWEEIGFVQGYGTTSSPKSYSFTDPLDLNHNLTRIDYRLKQIDNDGIFAYSKIVTVDLTSITSVDDEVIYEFVLEQNYPNPFNPSTTIKFTIPSVVDAKFASTTTKLVVYDILGREVATLVNQKLQPGNHEVQFDASDLSSGMYFYKLTNGKFSEIKKLMLLK